ncbi:MAG TPA: hypothetical protein VKR21_16800 [Solirubrobacteraceae bacterium]|nr:hypothetical protein [Solirubrobacteraceae bacterium]
MPALGWRAAVGASAVIVAALVLALGVGWLASLRSSTSRYVVSKPLHRVELVVTSGDALIVGTQASTLEVRRTDHYAFGHEAIEHRSLRGGVLRIDSSCPKVVVGSCSASYELAVPETVSLSIRTTGGNVRLTGFRGTAAIVTGTGNVDVEAYCGFDLAATTRSGRVRIASACTPQHLEVRTRTGDATALVPPGSRYRISAISGVGQPRISGVVRDRSAPFTIDMHSGSGRLTIGAGL